MSSRTVQDTRRLAITPGQCRAARGLLGWTQADLIARTKVARGSIIGFEAERTVPIARTLEEIKACFEAQGIEFLGEETGGVGVRLLM